MDQRLLAEEFLGLRVFAIHLMKVSLGRALVSKSAKLRLVPVHDISSCLVLVGDPGAILF
jgi:hypothetical protein